MEKTRARKRKKIIECKKDRVGVRNGRISTFCKSPGHPPGGQTLKIGNELNFSFFSTISKIVPNKFNNTESSSYLVL